jgi:hypothetical protein
MYHEFCGVFVLITLGTVAFTKHVSEAWIRPFVLLTAAVALATAAMYKHLKRIRDTKKTDDPPREELGALLAGGIWHAWMTYGVLFGDVPPVVSGVWAYVHGGAIVVLVLLSHSHANARRDGRCATALLVGVVALLFLPHPDTISRRIDPVVLFSKILAFYVLFAIVEVAHKLDFEARTRAGDAASPAQRVYAAQVQVVQTAWILLSIVPLMAIALVQIIILGAEIHGHLRERAEAIVAATRLPTTATPQEAAPAAVRGKSRRLPLATTTTGGEKNRKTPAPPPPGHLPAPLSFASSESAVDLLEASLFGGVV